MSNAGDNSSKMTFEEKVVEHIKKQAIEVLIDDPDGLTELTVRAVNEALFKDRYVKEGYSERRTPSPVMAAAELIANAALEKIFKEEVQKLVDNPDVRAAMQTAIAKMLPVVLLNSVDGMLHSIRASTVNDAINGVQTAIENGSLQT